MKNAKMIISKDFKIGRTDDMLFGSFVEHMGTAVYNGIYEPGHSEADPNGFRKDVMELAKELQLKAIRYPGGNFSSGYNWEDTIGPKEKRPVKLELAWRAMEPNSFGLNEFLTWSGMLGVAPIMTVNLGTRGIDAARNIVEYCNFPQGSYWSDLRTSHGYQEPHRVKFWCLGNELDGAWQIGYKTADEYGRLACKASSVMKLVDPDIKLIAVGSSSRTMATFPEWDQTVLTHAYEQVDYLSLHNYIGKKSDDTATYLARALDMDKQIRKIVATCDYVKSKLRSNKTMYLSFDEWSVVRKADVQYTPWQIGSPFDWVRFTMEDVLAFGSMLLTLLRNADRVKIACQSLLVNTNSLILTEKGGKAWRNSTFYPLLHASRYGRGEVLINVLDSPKYDTTVYSDVPVVDSVAVFSEERNEVTVFAINRGNEQVMLEMDIRDFPGCSIKEHIILQHEDLNAVNTAENPFEIVPAVCNNTVIHEGRVESILAKYSWNVIRFDLNKA